MPPEARARPSSRHAARVATAAPRRRRAPRGSALAAALVLLAPLGAAADFEKGLEAAKRREYEAAFAEFLPAARSGHAQAQLHVANMYRRGYGVARDYAAAARWYRAAAELGEPSGMYNYAVHLREGLGVERDPGAATAWFEKAADLGHPPSMLNVGLRYYKGNGVERDPVKGYAWVHRAAGKGSVPAIRARRSLEEDLSADDIERGRALARELP